MPCPAWRSNSAAVVIATIWSAFAPENSYEVILSCACAVLGAWLIVAPLALGNGTITANVWNDVVVGIVVLVLGAWSAAAGMQLHGGGRAHLAR